MSLTDNRSAARLMDGDTFFAVLYCLMIPLVVGLALVMGGRDLTSVLCSDQAYGAARRIHGAWPLAALLSGSLAVGAILVRHWWHNTLGGRMYNATAAMVFCALIMHFGGGSGEAHFPFFILTSFLLVYRDWRPILWATILISLHHLAFFVLQMNGAPLILFRCLDLNTLWVHLLFGVVQGGLLSALAQKMKQEAHDRDQSQADLTASEQRFRRLFDYSPDPVWIIAGQHFVDCNAAAVAALGYQNKNDVLNRSPVSMSPPIQPDGQPSDTKARYLLRLAQEQGQCRFDWMHVRADGRQFPVEVTLSLMRLEDEVVYYCCWRDISDRKQAEDQLRLAASVYQHASEGILVTGPDSTVLSVNPAFTRITGYGVDDIVGRKPNLLRSHHHDDAFYGQLWRTLLQTGHWQGEVWNRRKDGSLYIQWQTISAVRDSHGAVSSYVSVFSDITEMRQSEDRIRHLAYHDALTGLPNRALLLDRLENAMGRARRNSQPLALMFLDLDHFKAINDTLGHDVGDGLLVETANRITNCLRATDTVARMGGDEFVILLEPAESSDDVARVAEKLIASVSQPLTIQGEVICVTTSVGIAMFPDDGRDATSLLKQADTAMYASKAGGRNAFRFFEGQMTEQTLARMHLERDLRQAIDAGAFELHYQPKFQVDTRECRGTEALVRWNHPKRGLIPPVDFIPLAEETGLIVTLGDWVIDAACQQIAQWQDHLPSLLPVAVNVSTKQLFTGDLVARIQDMAQRHGARLNNLQIEITESAVMGDPDQAAIILSRLRELGMTIAIDDFGTGYSSLSYLTKFPIDVIKIDRSFVMGMNGGQQNIEIINAIISLGHSLGMEVVAEGVETDQEITILSQAKCPVGQGYLFARPMPCFDLMGWLGRVDLPPLL